MTKLFYFIVWTFNITSHQRAVGDNCLKFQSQIANPQLINKNVHLFFLLKSAQNAQFELFNVFFAVPYFDVILF